MSVPAPKIHHEAEGSADPCNETRRQPVPKLLTEFKAFLFRGNVMDLAVAIVVGTAFTALVKALVTDLLTPLIAAIFGAHNFGNLKFTIHHSTFAYGDFINNMITFLSVAAAVFFLVVAPINALMARRAKEDPDTSRVRSATGQSRSRRAAALSAPRSSSRLLRASLRSASLGPVPPGILARRPPPSVTGGAAGRRRPRRPSVAAPTTRRRSPARPRSHRPRRPSLAGAYDPASEPGTTEITPPAPAKPCRRLRLGV